MSDFRAPLEEVCDGVLAWSGTHPVIGQPVHSAYAPASRTAFDPIAADGLADAIAAAGGLERIVLSNRHHRRSYEDLVGRFGDVRVLAPAAGMHEFGAGTDIEPYEWGEELAPGIVAHEIGVICPDDGAIHIATGPGALLIADSVIRWDGRLAFVPDFLMDDPEDTKAGTLRALEPLLDLDWDVLLLAHGEPSRSGGKAELESFIAKPRSADFSM